MAPSRVLLTGGEQHYVVAASRALHEAGFAVTAGASFLPALAHVSRFHDDAVWLPRPHVEPEQHAHAIRKVLESRHHDVVIPGDEASLLAISECRDLIDGLVRTGLPSHQVVVRSLDKAAQLEIAATVGIPGPPSLACRTEAEGRRCAQEYGYPVVIKPYRSQIATDGGLRHQKSLLVESDHELPIALRLVGIPFLVQACVPRGTVYSCSGVFAGGSLQAVAFARYRRTWPRRAGSASYAETLPISAELLDKVIRFLLLVEHQGIFEIEFIGTDPDHLLFIDFNPRLYGSLVLAVRAGANLPVVWCRWLLGQSGPLEMARPGFRYRWEEGEIHNLIDRLKRRRVREAIDIIRPRRRVANALFRANDPGPFVARVAYAARRLRRRADRAT
jgi:biotin carboxylase